MYKHLPFFIFLLLFSGLKAQIREETPVPAPVEEPQIKGPKTRFGRYRTGVPQHVQEGDKTGWALDDSLLVPIQFYKMPNVYSDFMVVHNYEGYWGVIDKHGRTVLPFEYEQGGQLYAWKVKDPTSFLSKNGRQQYFDPQGNVLFETQFEALDAEATNRIGAGRSGLLVATKIDPTLGEVSAIVDHAGKVLFPFKYYRIAWVTTGLVCVTEGQQGKNGVRDWNDREILPLQYTDIAPPDINGHMAVSLAPDQKGLVNTTGRVLIPFEYQECGRRFDISTFYDLKKGASYGLADHKGRVIIPVDAPFKPMPVAYTPVHWERAQVGLKMSKKGQIRGDFWIQKLSNQQSVLYHVEQGRLFEGNFSQVQILDEKGPVVAYMKNAQQRLYDLQGRDLMGGDRNQITVHEYRTCILANKSSGEWQIHGMDGALVTEEAFGAPGPILLHGFFTMPDMNGTFALFDPFGKRLTTHHFKKIENPDDNADEKARKNGKLKPGRHIVAKGLIESPEQEKTWVYIDQMGEY